MNRREGTMAKKTVIRRSADDGGQQHRQRQRSPENTHSELEQRLEFEMLLGETSSRYINLPADQTDGEIEDTQRRICKFLNLDRSSLGQVSEREPGALLLTHMHQPPGGPPISQQLNLRKPSARRGYWRPGSPRRFSTGIRTFLTEWLPNPSLCLRLEAESGTLSKMASLYFPNAW